MKIKNTAKGGRGIGVAGHDPIEWAPGETKDVADDIIAKAKKDPANAAMFGDDGDLQPVFPRVSVNDAEAESKKGAAK